MTERDKRLNACLEDIQASFIKHRISYIQCAIIGESLAAFAEESVRSNMGAVRDLKKIF